jgi:hypothetical protein
VPGGHLIFLCVARIPARTDVTLDSVVDSKATGANVGEGTKTYRQLLAEDIERKKTVQEVGDYYKRLEEGSKIENYLIGEFDAESVATPASLDPTARQGAGN